jgi:hypothetical protein
MFHNLELIIFFSAFALGISGFYIRLYEYDKTERPRFSFFNRSTHTILSTILLLIAGIGLSYLIYFVSGRQLAQFTFLRHPIISFVLIPSFVLGSLLIGINLLAFYQAKRNKGTTI